MTHRTVPSTIYVVQVDDRMDNIYAFSSRREAERFRQAVEDNGGSAEASDVPLNLTMGHTDDLITGEADV